MGSNEAIHTSWAPSPTLPPLYATSASGVAPLCLASITWGRGWGCWPVIPWILPRPGLCALAPVGRELLRNARAFLTSTFLMSLVRGSPLRPPMEHNSLVGFLIHNIPLPASPLFSAQHFYFSQAGHHLFQVSKEPRSSVILARVLGPVS